MKLGLFWAKGWPLALTAILLASCAKPVTLNAVVPVAPAPAEPEKSTYTEISLKSQGQRVPILMFHDIVAKRTRHSVWFDCSASEFTDLLDNIAKEGFTPISLDQLYGHLTKGETIPEKSIVLTFDDNYQGYFDNAYPELHRRQIPSVMFVHTGFVGVKTGDHPKMDWPTLKTLTKDPLVTIGSHTISHPDDITKLSTADQIKELQVSKATLEKELGKPMDYFAYPDGKNDQIVQQEARTAGYKMAFTIHNGLAEESPNIMAVNRYIHTRFSNAVEDWNKTIDGGALGVFFAPIKTSPVRFEEDTFDRVELALTLGGTPETLMSDSREGVLDFIHRNPGTVAGINGGFFALAAISSRDNQMVGPVKTENGPGLVPDESTERWEKLRNRPLIMWGATYMAIIPFQPETMRSVDAYFDFMPDMTNLFMAGVWLVHSGIPRTRSQMNTFASKDIQDPRRRSFIGIKPDGTVVLGASKGSCSSSQFASAIAQAGVSEAVLLDSGFSTSLVYGESIKASGHSTPTEPSRPVPHAILLKGELDPMTAALGAPDPVVEVEAPKPRRRKRSRPSVEPSTPDPAPDNPQ